MGQIDRSCTKSCDPEVEGNVSIHPEPQVSSGGRVADVPLGVAASALEVAYPVEKAEHRSQQSHGNRVAMKLGPVVERADRRRCGLAQKDDGKEAEAFRQVSGVRRRSVGFARYQ